MVLLAHVRRVLAQHPWVYWAGVAGLAMLAGLLVARAAAGVDDAKAAWGEPRPVLVAVADIAPGSPLAGATELRSLPSPVAPDAAVSEIAAGATARQRIATGEIVVEHDVAPTGSPQALIPEGWLAVAIAEPVPSGAGVGDAVGVSSGGVLLARDAVVVGATADAILVAVPAGVAPQVAHAAAGGDVAVLVAP
jgi:hypothetical protein